MTKLLTSCGLMRNNSFYETFLNFSHFFNFSHCFCSNYKFEIANMFHFSRSMWSESFNCFKQILGKLFWESVVCVGFWKMSCYFWNWSRHCFHFSKILVFWVINGVKRAKIGPKWQKLVSVGLHISGAIHHMIVIYGTLV